MRRRLIGLTSVAFAASGSLACAQSHAQLEQVTKPQIAALVASKAKRTEAQEKISSGLLDTVKQAKTGHVSAAAPKLKAKAVTSLDQPVKIVIRTTTETPSPALLAEVARLGGTDVEPSLNFPVVNASVPASALETLAAFKEVKTVRRLQAPIKHAATWAVEGRIAHTADQESLKGFDVTGAGVVVCVLSDSLDNLGGAKSQAFNLGALGPAEINVLQRPDRPGAAEDGVGTESESGEGLAMLEIVHAIAPDAALWFATGNGGAAHLADNILELRKAARCDIMVDDLTYPTESPFQDDDISVAVDRVSQEGVLYFSSARNSGNKKYNTSGTWEGVFHDGGPADPKFGLAPGTRVHVFENGKTVNTADTVVGDGRVDLFWSDPLGEATNGYDLFVIRASGHVTHASTSSTTGTQDPYQSVDDLEQGDSIMIVKEGGAAPRFLHLEAGNTILRYSTGGSVRGHNASGAENAFTVAARRVTTPAAPFLGGADAHVEAFSADGPRRVFFKANGDPYTPGDFSETGGLVRPKPDITAADGVTTTLPVDTPLNPFSGTSAAAPHAAGIAALMLSCKGHRPTPAEVRSAFKRSAIAIEGDSGNANAGYGVIMAKSALQDACPQAAPAPPATGGGL